ncbi:MAG: MFS transporter [Bacteroidota bacterium]
MKSARSSPYIDLIRGNRNFRLLWASQMVSNFGDWFGILAVYALIQEYSDSEFLLGLIIVTKMVSLAIFSPLAGYIVDRMNRKRLMVICDLGRGGVVLGFLLIGSAETLWLAYLLTALQMMMSAIFQPAKTSSIPNVTSTEELVYANILSAASWSVIFTTGMALGGMATALMGTDYVFLLNAISYLYSAWIIWRATVPQTEMSQAERKRTKNPWTGILEGFDYLKRHPDVSVPTLAKGAMTASLGALVYLLILISDQVLQMGSMGLGILYAARGVGTGIGPVLGRRWERNEKRWIRMMGFCMVLCGIFYLPLAWTETLWIMCLLVVVAHMASGSNWVMSTVLIQRRSDDLFRGRVFSSEWLLFTLMQSFSVTTASLLLEFEWLTLSQTISLFATTLTLTGLYWIFRATPGSGPIENGDVLDRNLRH